MQSQNTRHHANFIDLKGQRFGRLLVLAEHGSPKGAAYWLCVCDCGKQHVARGTELRNGQIKSCGCFRASCCPPPRHGEAWSKTASGTPEYKAWMNMKGRCASPRAKWHGARGITVCDRWLHSYENFLADMGRKPASEYSIDRIDNDGNYEPGNCRWATKAEQSRNQRPRQK